VQEPDQTPAAAPSGWAFALAIFTGAFLLFQVQPLIGKYILPWFGGGPGVWTTCLLFFQCMLFAGYAYAHLLNHFLPHDRQATLHLVVLLVALVMANITPGDAWKPAPGEEPVGKILGLLMVSVGLPYLVLASTGPLLQAWFSRAHPGRSPYRLYALSNVGSLLALLSFPFIVEPNITRVQQMDAWSWILRGFLVLYAFIAWRMRSIVLDLPTDGDEAGVEEETQRGGSPFLWLLLPAIGTMLLMSSTSLICQEIAVIPFLWVVPLALYLLTFIIAFDSPRWYVRPFFVPAFFIAAGASCWALVTGVSLAIQWQLGIYITALFLGCMVCHGELFRLRPPSSRLTSYYLCIAGGGALGGLFVSVGAPALFTDFFWEFHIALFLCGLTGGILWVVGMFREQKERGEAEEVSLTETIAGVLRNIFPPQTVALLLIMALSALAWGLWKHTDEIARESRYSSRNFYGLLKVTESWSHYENNNTEKATILQMVHGRIMHGSQFERKDLAQMRGSYFAPQSGVGIAMTHAANGGPKKVGVLGLGVGAVAAYANPGDTYRFYEINPAVEHAAEKIFTFLKAARERGAKVDVVLGDGRLMLEAEPDDAKFDVLSMDAFSSDSVPVHLLTTEAFEIYEKHLEPGGVIVINITNRYLDLEPVVREIAKARKLHYRVIHFWPPRNQPWFSHTSYVLLSTTGDFFKQPEIHDAALRHHKVFADQLEDWIRDSGQDISVLKNESVANVLETLSANATDLGQKNEFKKAAEIARRYYVDDTYLEDFTLGEILDRREPKFTVPLWTDDYSSLFPIIR